MAIDNTDAARLQRASDTKRPDESSKHIGVKDHDAVQSYQQKKADAFARKASALAGEPVSVPGTSSKS